MDLEGCGSYSCHYLSTHDIWSYMLWKLGRYKIRNMKGCFVGSGSEGLQQPEVFETIISLTKKVASDVTVLYIGTATYDLPGPKHNQTIRFVEAGCKVNELKCAHDSDCATPSEMANLCENADAIIVSGGNTLYAIDKWNSIGLVPHLRSAADRGAVLTGGSAGAICWFDAGHSDSADPDTYKMAMMTEAAAELESNKDEASAAPTTLEEVKSWQYMRVPCLGFFPGLVCPHADKIQSNGVLRSIDFDAMLLRHPGERGICIDHFAALVVDGDAYSVLSLAGRPGSVTENGEHSSTREGVPGIWIKEVTGEADGSGSISTRLVPPTGSLTDVLRVAENIVQDIRLDACREANPI